MMNMQDRAAKLIAAALVLVLSALGLAITYVWYTDPVRRADVFCHELETVLTCNGDETACMVHFHKSLSAELGRLKNSHGSFWKVVLNLDSADELYQQAKEAASRSWKKGSPVVADEIDRLLIHCENLVAE
nr:hypothetical protein [uncultured Dongia sp.]